MLPSLNDLPKNTPLGIASFALAILTSSFFLRNSVQRQSRMNNMESKQNSVIASAHVSDVFTPSELAQINASFGESGPEGLFYQGRHGFTHFILDKPPSDGVTLPDDKDKDGNLIVMAHGLGTSSRAYRKLAKHMTALGYYVVRYDYFGHGYSKYNGADMWLEYSSEMLVDQLEDLLDHISSIHPTLKVSALVGHSTGGLVGICASTRWTASRIHGSRVLPRIILLSPALWANKPFVAQIADKIPRTLTSLIKNISSLKVLITDSYCDAIKTAFAIDPQTKTYVYEDAEKEQRLVSHRIFGKIKDVPCHPFIHASVMGLNCHTLRADLLPIHRQKMVQILQDTNIHSTQHVLFVWGNLDVTVPYKKNIDKVKKWAEEYPQKFNLKEMDRMGHELLYEDSDSMAKVIQTFIRETN